MAECCGPVGAGTDRSVFQEADKKDIGAESHLSESDPKGEQPSRRWA